MITDRKKLIIKNNVYKFEDNIYKEVEELVLKSGCGYWIRAKKNGSILCYKYE